MKKWMIVGILQLLGSAAFGESLREKFWHLESIFVSKIEVFWSKRHDPKLFVKEFIALQDPVDTIRKVMEYYPELLKLTEHVNASPEGIGSGQSSLSKIIFNVHHHEFDRTATSVLLLQWILQGNYRAFIEAQAGSQLTQENFDHLKNYTASVLKTPEDIDAMIAYVVLNDLGKIKSVVEEVQSKTQTAEVDHDKILKIVLERFPDLAPSFKRLSVEMQRRILKSLNSEFDLVQLIQGEGLPQGLSGLKDLDPESFHVYVLHAIADLGGAAGHVNWKGSMTLTDPVYEGVKLGIQAAEKVVYQQASEVEAYRFYLSQRGHLLQWKVKNNQDYALSRLLAMGRIFDPQQAQQMIRVFKTLPKNVKSILIHEMNKNGIDDGYGIRLYYSPALWVNLINFSKKNSAVLPEDQAFRRGMILMAQLYQEARIALKNVQGSGVFTLMVSEIAEEAKQGLLQWGQKKIKIDRVEQDGVARWVQRPVIDAKNYTSLSHLSALDGHGVLVVGMGGGSDGLQAAQLGLLLQQAGKDLRGVVSVRAGQTTSQGVSGKIGEKREVLHHGGEVMGVYKMLSETTGTGRFLENLPSREVPMYLLVEQENFSLVNQLRSLCQRLGGVDAIIALDTGGDSLESIYHDGVDSTPDQDLRVAQAIHQLSEVPHKISAIVAVGIDSPDHAGELLKEAGATYYTLSPAEVNQVQERYRAWGITGKNDERYGKTVFIWQKALSGEYGLQVLPLPKRVVMDPKNPWNPFAYVDKSMEGIFFMPLQDHVKVITSPKMQ